MEAVQNMDKQRAQEIAASPVMANVTYQGKQIYIQHVDDQSGRAHIFPLDQPEQVQEVSVEELIEHS